MRRYRVDVMTPTKTTTKLSRQTAHTPYLASRDHALWYAATMMAWDAGREKGAALLNPVAIEVSEIAE